MHCKLPQYHSRMLSPALYLIWPAHFPTATHRFYVCSPQNKPCILPHNHSTLLTTNYAMYSSSQPLHTATTKYAVYSSSQPLHSAHHKICHVFFLTTTPLCSPQNMPHILPHNLSTLLTTKYAVYSSSQQLHFSHHKICHVFLLTATPLCSPQDMPCIHPHSHCTLLTNFPRNLVCPVYSYRRDSFISAHLAVFVDHQQ